MTRRGGAVHVVTTKREHNGKVYHSHLLRRSFRQGGHVRSETVGNLSHLPDHVVELVRRSLRGERFTSTGDFESIKCWHHGHVRAVLEAMERLGFERLLGTRRSRQRDLVVGMVAARILEPASKLATSRSWSTTTLPGELGIDDATEDDLYEAMDWLLDRQEQIEKKLARRHLSEDCLALYDLTSSYFEGVACPLARRGYNRDRKSGRLQVNYGLLTDTRGCPIAVSVYEGNTGDPTTLLPQARKLQETYGVKCLALVGDRGMITQKQINTLKNIEEMRWITALRSAAIRELVEQKSIQPTLFDERSLFEITHQDYPGERLIACRNVDLARERAYTRASLIEATTKLLQGIQRMVSAGEVKGKAEIGVRVGRIINKHKVAKHFRLTILDSSLAYELNDEKIQAEAALDGLYVIRTNVETKVLDTEDTVRSYKQLSNVERAFRSLKTVDLKVRPMFHHLETRVRAHIFLCMLAYYVEWHMREVWRELLFGDEDQEAKKLRDPVAPAQRSPDALHKVHSHKLTDGTDAHSFATMLSLLSTVVRSQCRCKGAKSDDESFFMTTIPDAKQQRALDLIRTITM